MARNGDRNDRDDDSDDQGTTIARMAAADGAGDDGISTCIQGCSDKTTKVDEYLSCVAACKKILGVQGGVFAGGSRIVIIG